MQHAGMLTAEEGIALDSEWQERSELPEQFVRVVRELTSDWSLAPPIFNIARTAAEIVIGGESVSRKF
jgi:hypothetical protein